jgi:predicted transcriptional regulator
MKNQKKKFIIDNWADMKLMFNDTRKQIIELCNNQPHSIKELSVILELNPGSIHNHIKKLSAAGYLKITETRIINGIEEKKYLKSAQFFSFAKLEGIENSTRNKFIAKEFSKESFAILEEDEQASARITKVTLDKDNFKIAENKLKELIQFLADNNGSGEIPAGLLVCFGKDRRL